MSRRLDLLKAGDLEVRASFGFSYFGRAEAEQHAFRLLGLLPAEFPTYVPGSGQRHGLHIYIRLRSMNSPVLRRQTYRSVPYNWRSPQFLVADSRLELD